MQSVYIGGPIDDSLGHIVLFAISGMLFLLSELALSGIEGWVSKRQPAVVQA